jgi:hypothetical protein
MLRYNREFQISIISALIPHQISASISQIIPVLLPSLVKEIAAESKGAYRLLYSGHNRFLSNKGANV